MNKINLIIIAVLGIGFLAGVMAAEGDKSQSICCEQTKSGFYCQDVPKEECKENVRQLPTSCKSTSYCKPGTCYDSNEGTCMDNTPQLVCNANEGVWNEQSPAQCGLGCCTLGDQAAFVTLVRCKKLSGIFGLNTNYNTGIKTEVECVLAASSQEKGACVYEFEFEKTCKFTTRKECSEGTGASNVKGEFFAGKLCSAEELGTKCGPTRETTCIPGRDEVYFVDSCGNAGNIYDSTKLTNKDYWSNMKTKTEACGANSENANSASCGNCNYLLGSYCRKTSADTGRASYGENICADLNCKKTANGNSYKHGESWCIFDDAGTTGKGVDSVGSRFFKHICINGEEVLEQCADFRQEECIQDKIVTSVGDFSQAACRVNRWQDCVVQTDKADCENSDRRDCLWKANTELFGKDASGVVKKTENKGICLPKNPPGLKFWEGTEAQSICAQGNAQCIVSFEKGVFGGEECKNNCECLEAGWEKERTDICMNLGDCGPNVNWLGQAGYKPGYNITTKNK